MDIVTHGMMGIALAAPWLGTHTAISVGFVLGSALPDLDAFSRCFGKQAFLKWHQGWTHSLPVITTIGLALWLTLETWFPEFSGVAIGLMLGAAGHSLLDLTNTYGVRILSPFTARRYCWEWLFFIDSVVIAMTVAAVVPIVSAVLTNQEPAVVISQSYGLSLLGYIGLKAWLRRRAGARAGSHAVAVIPSALRPWIFLVCTRTQERVVSQELNALTGATRDLAVVERFDNEFKPHLAGVIEYQTMSALSPAYHVVGCDRALDQVVVHCRDLRIINFGTSFGRLDVTFNTQFEVLAVELHV